MAIRDVGRKGELSMHGLALTVSNPVKSAFLAPKRPLQDIKSNAP